MGSEMCIRDRVVAAQRADGALARELRALEREALRLRDAAEARAGRGAGAHVSYETGARALVADVLVTRAAVPVGGVRERAIDRWR